MSGYPIAGEKCQIIHEGNNRAKSAIVKICKLTVARAGEKTTTELLCLVVSYITLLKTWTLAF
jgi:hypothetical protein